MATANKANVITTPDRFEVLDLLKLNAPYFWTQLSDAEKAGGNPAQSFSQTTFVEGAFPIDFSAKGNVPTTAGEWAVIFDPVNIPAGTTSSGFPSTMPPTVFASFTIESTDAADTLGGDGLQKIVVTKFKIPGIVEVEIVEMDGTGLIGLTGLQSVVTFKDFLNGDDLTNAGIVTMKAGGDIKGIMPENSMVSRESLVIVPPGHVLFLDKIICRSSDGQTMFRLQTLGPTVKNYQARTYISGEDLVLEENFCFTGPGLVFVQGRHDSMTPTAEVQFSGTMYQIEE